MFEVCDVNFIRRLSHAGFAATARSYHDDWMMYKQRRSQQPCKSTKTRVNHSISPSHQPPKPSCEPVAIGQPLRSLTTETTSKLNVLRLDGDTLGMDGAEVGVFEEGDEVSLDGLLESTDGRGLESQVGLEILSDFTNKALEGELSDEELGTLLVTTDLTESNGTCNGQK